MGTEAIEKLYKNFSILADSKENIAQHSNVYLEILAAVKGTGKEKILASQFITRFFKYFPDLAHEALDVLLDLCEDEDVLIRKQAIKDLPTLAKDNRHYAQKISDILAQLLQAEDAGELAVVHNSLMSIMRADPKGCLSGIFSQILTGEDSVREKCLKFLLTKIRSTGKEFMTKDSEELLITEAKKVLQDVTAQEFNILMELLGGTRLGTSVSGQQELVDLVADQAEIQQAFCPNAGEESELLDRLINCVRHALPYFSSQIPSTKFVVYVIDNVLPQLDKLLGEEESTMELELLKVFAELTTYCGTVDDPNSKLSVIYQRLLKYLPLPPPDVMESTDEPRLEFSHVECLMYAFHRVLKQYPEFVSDPTMLKDFKLRLQYFARGIQGYIKKLREALSGKSTEELASKENKLKVVALKTTNNINILIKDLFHSPPSFKSAITLSWGPTKVPRGEKIESTAVLEMKRHTPITFSESKTSSGPKRSRELYHPPGGKFSNRIAVPSGRARGGALRGRGRFRGRNYGRPY